MDDTAATSMVDGRVGINYNRSGLQEEPIAEYQEPFSINSGNQDGLPEVDEDDI